MGRMTPADAAELLAMIVDQMPHVKYGPRAVVGFTEGLGDLDRDGVFDAIRVVLRRAEFGPTVAAIRDEYYRQHGVATAEEAWQSVLHATKLTMTVTKWTNPLMSPAIASVGGLSAIRMTEHPELLRKDFLQAYQAMRVQELGTPQRVAEQVGIGHGGRDRELAGSSEADRAAEATASNRLLGREPSRPGLGSGIVVPDGIRATETDRRGRGG